MDAKERSREIWDQMAPGWERQQAFLWRTSEPLARWMVDALDPMPGQTILDIAAGPGDTGFLAAERGAHLISTDFAAEMTEVAARAARARGLNNVETRQLDAEKMDLADGSVDGAVLMGSPLQVSLGHVVVLFRQLRRTLSSGAPLVVVVPNTDSLRIGAREVWRDPGVRRPVPPSLYAEIVELAGFAKPDVRTLRAASTSLAEDVADPKLASNMRMLNELLFGAEISAVIARK